MTRNAGETGMSLVELLVALVLLSLVGVAIASGLKLGAGAAARYERTSGSHMEVAFGQAALRRLIESARPVAAVSASAGEAVVAGDAQSLTLLVEPPDELGLGGAYEVALAAGAADGGKHLVAAFRRYPPGSGSRDAPHETVLVENIDEVTFRYFGKARNGEGPAWTSAWSGERSLPDLISIAVIFKAGDARRWPDFVAGPRIEEVRLP